uniref:Uncharacterized protein n=1 Tax=viral metagenome TaxID=1070528 RepID=A0A6H1ZVI5_9ZZZZ
MATLFQELQFFDGNGDPLSGGKVYWYNAGTVIAKDTYVDEAESAAAANPVILDAEGRPDHGSGADAMWIRGSYKMVLKDADDVTITTLDNINEYDSADWTGLTATIADLNSTTTTSVVKTTTYTIVAGDRGKTILADATTAPFTINLLAAATAGNKYKITIKKVDTTVNKVTIDPSGAETADGRATIGLYDYNDFIELQSDGSNWHRVSSLVRGTLYGITLDTIITADDENKVVSADATGGAIAVTLPSAATVCRGWRLTVKKIAGGANNVTLTPDGVETIDAAATKVLVTLNEAVSIISDGTNWKIISETSATSSKEYPPGYIYGLAMSNDAGDTANDINVAAGACRDIADTFNIDLATPIIKQMDVTWAAGSGAGGRASGCAYAINTWYHVFIIATSGGAVDVGFDTDIDATNLLVDAVGYVYYRRIGSVMLDAAKSVRQFFAHNTLSERIVLWRTPYLDYTGAPTTTRTLQVVTTPLDINAHAIMKIDLQQGVTHDVLVNVCCPEETDAVPSGAASPGAVVMGFPNGGACQTEILTDTSSQLAYRASSAAVDIIFTLITAGWKE